MFNIPIETLHCQMLAIFQFIHLSHFSNDYANLRESLSFVAFNHLHHARPMKKQRELCHYLIRKMYFVVVAVEKCEEKKNATMDGVVLKCNCYIHKWLLLVANQIRSMPLLPQTNE